MTDTAAPTTEAEREFSRCTTCGKRIARLAPPEPVPCPERCVVARHCPEVFGALVRARQITSYTGNALHPETQALFERWGGTWAEIDAEIARLAQREVDDREFRFGPLAEPLHTWIDGKRDRALIVVKEALAAIDLTNGGTRTMGQILDEAAGIEREVAEIAAAMAQQDWEMGDDGEPAA